jgi:molybdate transport system ATP-binding protein
MSGLAVDVRLAKGDFALAATFQLPPSGVMAIVGPSGSGKTTLLRLLAGLERPDAGCIRCGDQPWCEGAHWVKPQGRRIGMVFQDYALFPHLTVLENVAFGLNGPDRWQQARSQLAKWQIDTLGDRMPTHLSGGERQRVALARALVTDPRLLLLDEPLSAIDSYLRHRLRATLREDLAGLSVPVVLVTHDLDDVRVLADTVGVMVAGSLRQSGGVRDVLASPESRAVAEVVGWRDFLPVTRWEGAWATGPWGSLQHARASVDGCRWLGIRPGKLTVARAKAANALPGRLLRCLDTGGRYESTWRLGDLQVSAYSEEPSGDGEAWLRVEPGDLLPLPD